MNEQDLLIRIKKYHNDIVHNCLLAVGHQEDAKCNLPWEDMTDWHRGYMAAVKDCSKAVEKEKIVDSS